MEGSGNRLAQYLTSVGGSLRLTFLLSTGVDRKLWLEWVES